MRVQKERLKGYVGKTGKGMVCDRKGKKMCPLWFLWEVRFIRGIEARRMIQSKFRKIESNKRNNWVMYIAQTHFLFHHSYFLQKYSCTIHRWYHKYDEHKFYNVPKSSRAIGFILKMKKMLPS
jgi:hypothetical protein